MHGVGTDPISIADRMSPRQIVATFEELHKHVNRDKASTVGLARAAHHAEAKDLQKLIADLTKFDEKYNSIGPEEFMKKLGGFNRNDR